MRGTSGKESVPTQACLQGYGSCTKRHPILVRKSVETRVVPSVGELRMSRQEKAARFFKGVIHQRVLWHQRWPWRDDKGSWWTVWQVLEGCSLQGVHSQRLREGAVLCANWPWELNEKLKDSKPLWGPHQAESRLQDWKALMLIGVITGESHCLNLEGSYCWAIEKVKKHLLAESAEAPRKAGWGEEGKLSVKLHREELGPVELGVQRQASKTKMHSASGSLFQFSVFKFLRHCYKTVSHSECPTGELSEGCLFSASVLHKFFDSGVGWSRQRDLRVCKGAWDQEIWNWQWQKYLTQELQKSFREKLEV